MFIDLGRRLSILNLSAATLINHNTFTTQNS